MPHYVYEALPRQAVVRGALLTRWQALAVHPDYLTRNSILKEMRERWLDLTPEGMHSVAAGLLRDGQYELALDKLEEMASKGTDVPSWLFDVFIYTLGQAGFHDEALKIAHHRVLKEGDQISLNIWYFLLDSCSRTLHYCGVKYVWRRMVETRILNPSDAMCLNILNTAARHHDAHLASTAMQHISSRGGKLGIHHFEPLLDCYAGANDIGSALQALCIMQNAGIRADRGSTRSIFLSLKRTPSLVDDALTALSELRTTSKIPVCALNVVVEGLLEKGDTETALNLYRHVRRYCPDGPDAATFALLEKCTDARVLYFLAQEMASFSIRPTPDMYEALILAHSEVGSLDLALQYAFALAKTRPSSAAGQLISRETAEALVRRCFAEEDMRVWDLVQASEEAGMSLEGVVQDVLREIPEEKRNAHRISEVAADPRQGEMSSIPG